MHDLVIIGAGMAGLTASIYAIRAGLDLKVIELDGWGGGQITSAHLVDNYPGIPGISGMDLGDRLKEHAESLGVQVTQGNVKEIISEANADAVPKKILLENGSIIEARAVIAATGAGPKSLRIPGEDELRGKGVSYCAVCDGGFFRDKEVFVVGGGNTAVEDALYLAGICARVTLVHRRDAFRAPITRLQKLEDMPNVEILRSCVPTAATGDGHVDGIDIKNIASGEVKHYDTNGVFIAVGTDPMVSYLQKLDLKFEKGYVVTDEMGRTSVPGIFAAGDIRFKELYQAVTAASDGACAATAAIEYLQEQN